MKHLLSIILVPVAAIAANAAQFKPDDLTDLKLEDAKQGSALPSANPSAPDHSATRGNFWTNQCDLSAKAFNQPMEESPPFAHWWTIFLPRHNDANSFQICINGDETILVPGIPAGPASIRIEQPVVVVETLSPANFISPDDALDGNATGHKFSSPGGQQYDVLGRSTYYIAWNYLPWESIQKRAQGNGSAISIDAVASASFSFDLSTQKTSSMEVLLHDIDEGKAASLVKKVLKLPAASGSWLAPPADYPILDDFVQTGVARLKAKGVPTADTRVTISLNIDPEATDTKAPRPVVSITSKHGKDDRQTSEDDILYWCSYPNPADGGKPFGFETRAQHAAHANP